MNVAAGQPEDIMASPTMSGGVSIKNKSRVSSYIIKFRKHPTVEQVWKQKPDKQKQSENNNFTT